MGIKEDRDSLLKSRIEEIKEDYDELRERIEESEDTIIDLKKKEEEKLKELSKNYSGDLEAEIEEIRHAMESYNYDITYCKEDLEELKEELDDLECELEDLE